jgi:ABC-type Fe3+ transport system substrate-binding protein
MNSELLKGLIAQANQEGSVSVETVDSALPASDSVKQAFLQYFRPLGLNVDVQFVGGFQTPDWENAQTAINSGSAPQIDLLLGNATPQVYPFLSITAPIDNWQELLNAVNPDAASGRSNMEDYSPAPFTGQALLFCDYYDALVYSTQVNPDSLPSNLSDLADPKYEGRLAVPAYAFYKLIPLVLVYGRDEALQMAKGIGANAAGVESSPSGIPDILARSIDFQVEAVDNLISQKASNANVPLDYRWFTDVTKFEQQFYAVPLNSKHPAAATLFALWSTTDVARISYAPNHIWLNLHTGHTANDEAAKKTLENANTTVVSLTSPEGLPTLLFLDTAEGQAYFDAFNDALTKPNGALPQEQPSSPSRPSPGGK